MTNSLRPYTVAAVVDTITGELIGTPIIHVGHRDHARLDTVKPLAGNEQFRSVHVWASDEASAAATDALTADLRTDADPTRPSARASTGTPGLRPFTVACAVDAHTGQAIGEPVAAAGHHGLSEAPVADRYGSWVHVANVWAADEGHAIAQVLDTGPEPTFAGRSAESRTGGHIHGQVLTAGAAVAQREWDRLPGLPAAARATLVADTLWRRHYSAAYRTAYAATASRIAASATDAAERNLGAWLTLHHLAAAAGQAISHLTPDQPTAPPADQQTVATARAAVGAAEAGAVGNQPWQRIADAVSAGSRTAATLAGTLTAATDVLVGWRSRFGPAMAEGVDVDGHPARVWVADLLATVNRDAATRIAAPGVGRGIGKAGSGRTAAQLAREDQAPAEPSTTPAVTTSRVRSAAPAATTVRRTR